ncbi:acetyl esterase/lipase [Caulobacter ginsengisoli]|uniref:Acetyl esterase/lipase n=1 Tax=Caulobacter ginsengisoli TaxID=400775 RepID=A0ABU0IXP9_9CAUL|nr:alpha/beta hydrolase [Caulobacter ginsengisoli]MDQ0466774.1 acetyl esterase/lipase [Caulobacter ginsengisoli]
MPRRLFAAALASLGLAGCSTVDVLNRIEPRTGVEIVRDVAFGPGAHDRLDIYRPRSGGPGPVVVFIYGGSWNSGSRSIYAFAGSALASHGYTVFIPDYRVYPEVNYPVFLQDNARAVRWARDHAGDYGGDPARLVLMGHSAGAYNAAMLAYDRRWLAAVGLDPRRDVKALIGLSGPYDFLPLHSDELKIIFGPEDQRPATQPINYVDGEGPPAFLGVGIRDSVVNPGNTARLAQRIRDKGGLVETRQYGRVTHAMTIGVFAAPLRGVAPVLRDVEAFIDSHT